MMGRLNVIGKKPERFSSKPPNRRHALPRCDKAAQTGNTQINDKQLVLRHPVWKFIAIEAREDLLAPSWLDRLFGKNPSTDEFYRSLYDKSNLEAYLKQKYPEKRLNLWCLLKHPKVLLNLLAILRDRAKQIPDKQSREFAVNFFSFGLAFFRATAPILRLALQEAPRIFLEELLGQSKPRSTPDPMG